ncbi:hypothetical protein [Natrinema salifodinae]|uniref:Uncharacterized protein n=1 Tax=Natrinema salifodinae TaxID=1202768 RepID=A0A1I0Q5R7_9EURY|nr:hypothetical protein [Natrinema salifodinae]SEW21891.1 hypothetical protein SAMN05216285_3072 [Natrinema salifodinae]
MGILDLMLGRSGTGDQGVEGQSYALPKETHDFVYPVAVRREEVEAVAELLDAEADAPSIEEQTDDLQAVFDGLGEEAAVDVDAEELAERMQQPRRAIEPVIEDWRERLDRDVGVVYVRSGVTENLAAFVKLCKRRGEDENDPFELPESVPNAAALLKRLSEGTDTQYQAVVHMDLLPNDR